MYRLSFGPCPLFVDNKILLCLTCRVLSLPKRHVHCTEWSDLWRYLKKKKYINKLVILFIRSPFIPIPKRPFQIMIYCCRENSTFWPRLKEKEALSHQPKSFLLNEIIRNQFENLLGRLVGIGWVFGYRLPKFTVFGLGKYTFRNHIGSFFL